MQNWQRLKVTVMLLTGLLVGCGQNSKHYSSNLQTVKPAVLPPLSKEARQQPRPQFCLPSCLVKLTEWREDSLRKLTELMRPGAAAKEAMTDLQKSSETAQKDKINPDFHGSS